MGARSDQNGAKRVPKWNQKATKMPPKIDARKRSPQGGYHPIFWEPFWSHIWTIFHQKGHQKSMHKSMSKKCRKSMDKLPNMIPNWIRKPMKMHAILKPADPCFLHRVPF